MKGKKMNLINRLILEEYRKSEKDFELMRQIVSHKLQSAVDESGIRTFTIQSRIKSEDSLAGKLVRKEGWYSQLSDLRDILGARVICYFADDVDRVGKLIEEIFDVDTGASTDKRELIAASTFGYLSLHYICRLPEGGNYPEELRKWRFEIQVRTLLQHVWSDVEHDIGYKAEFGMPRKAERGFARISALLELADDEFVRVRDLMGDYTESVRTSIIEDTADDVRLDVVSLGEYVRLNKPMRELLNRMADASDAQIEEYNPAAYVEQLEWLGITTIGGLSRMLAQNEEMALKLLEHALEATDLDIISSSTGLRYLCHAEVCRRGMDVETVAEFLALSLRDPARAQARAKHLLGAYAALSE